MNSQKHNMTNFYMTTLQKHTKKTKVTKTKNVERSINLEAKNIAKQLGLEDRIETIARNEPFLKLKDHKDNFKNNLPCRLLVPSKSEIGHISKKFLDRINSDLRKKLKFNQWKNTTEVTSWFTKIEKKYYMEDDEKKVKNRFIQFDIKEFYPKITKDIFEKALSFAKKHTEIKRDELRIIRHSRKSLLFHKGEAWVKSNTSNSFDVTMGSYDGAEVCELVGLYILNDLTAKNIVKKEDLGLYRDDGLLSLKHNNGGIAERLKQKIIQSFKEIGFDIEININLITVDFLDVTLDLLSDSYRPYKKPNDKLLYIHKESNHPRNILKHLPISINKRLNQNSSNKNIFDHAKTEYEEALKQSGYKKVKLEYDPALKTPKQTRNKNRKRKIIWFNPPFSKNVSTDIGKQFLKLIEKHFPPHHRLHKIFNKNTIKISYSCTKNMNKIITGHNKKVLSKTSTNTNECNCRIKQDCPLPGKCRQKSVIYKCTVSVPEKPDKVYIGLTEAEFKTRYASHKSNCKNEDQAGSTALSTYFHKMKKEAKTDPLLKWEILKTVPAYSNITKRCLLCLQEKFEILSYKKQGELLNKRSELVAKCRHQNKFLLKNLK